MSTVGKLRLDIIERLFKIEDVEILKSIRHQLQAKREKRSDQAQATAPDFLEAVTPIRKEVSLDQILKEQNYKPISYEEFRKKADEIEWEASLEELLEALTA